MKITVTDWCYNEVIFKGINGFIPWGKTLLCKGNVVEVFSAIECEVLRETDKALYIQFPYSITKRYNCDIIRTVDWKVWIPKSCILHTPDGAKYGYEFLTHADFGMYSKITVRELLPFYEEEGYIIKKKW